jgi:hypothetical protein
MSFITYWGVAAKKPVSVEAEGAAEALVVSPP